MLLAATASAARAQVDEARLKAAFVYNIVAFSSWNAAPPDARLHVCTATGGPLDAELARLEGRQLGQRRIDVRRGFGAGCDVVVRGARDLAPPASPSTLVICDGCALPDGSSAVSLLREDDRIRFEVDAAAATRAGIGFSSQLLRLARRVL
jgi:uncharacterized protein DUF4154